MILHIADDEKFIDNAIELFETVSPNKNLYLINHDSKNNLQYIKYRGDKIFVFPYKSKEYTKIIKGDYKAIIFHNLNEYKCELIRNFQKKNVHLHWLSWGFDYYGIPSLKKTLLLSSTNKIYLKNLRPIDRLYLKISITLPALWNLLNYLRYFKTSDYFKLKSAVKRINSVSTVVETEYPLIKKYLSNEIKYYPFRYGSIEQFGKGILNEVCKHDDILIGNSATFTGNHLEVFELIKNQELKSQIFVPLSYGDKTYAKFIANEGDKLFGSRFHPIFNFLTLEEYNKILNNCGIVFMNHIRQQAMGNIIISLWLGAKVYLQRQNPIYQFFIKNKFKVFDISEFTAKIDETHEDLANWNRKKLTKYYNHDIILELTRNLITNLDE